MKHTKQEPSTSSEERVCSLDRIILAGDRLHPNPNGGASACCICGHAWSGNEWAPVRKIAKDGEPYYCLLCSSLEMARRAAHNRKISLREAVRRYCASAAEWENATSSEIWRGVQSDEG